MQSCHFVLCTKNYALPVSPAVYKILYQAVNTGSAVSKILYQAIYTGSAVYTILYTAVDTGSAVYKILYTALPAFTAWYKILYTALYNISRCRIQSRNCRDSHPDQGYINRFQPGNINLYYKPKLFKP